MRLFLVMLGAVGCACCAERTLIRADEHEGAPAPIVEVECVVVDVESATDLPQRAKNLGWVSVTELSTEEETAHALHDRVCAMGGDALTRVSRVRQLGEAGFRLEGNAWKVGEVPASAGFVRNTR